MQKIKQIITNSLQSEKGKDVLTIIIVILVGLGSFELGRLSKGDNSAGIRIEYPKENAMQSANVVSSFAKPQNYQNPSDKNFFASNKGSKYYSIGCSGGKTIKQENRIYFKTKEEAKRAGYELSSSCR